MKAGRLLCLLAPSFVWYIGMILAYAIPWHAGHEET